MAGAGSQDYPGPTPPAIHLRLGVHHRPGRSLQADLGSVAEGGHGPAPNYQTVIIPLLLHTEQVAVVIFATQLGWVEGKQHKSASCMY